MSDKIARLAAVMRGFQKEAMPLFTAEVISVQGESCTVLVGDLEVTEVRLKATINGAGNYVLTVPKTGSYVLIGSLSGDLKDLAVLKVDEVESFTIKQGSLEILVDSADNKVSVKNADASLYNLFNSLTTLLKQIKVYTPSGVSGVPILTSQQQIMQFETDFKKLLK